MEVYVAELVGTMLLVLLGCGANANVLLSKSKGEGSGWIVIATGWGLAVAIAVYAVGRISGAHINPAVTVGLASIGEFPWSQVPGYVVAQTAGAILGASLVWLAYSGHWGETSDPGTKLGVFSTAPAIRSPVRNILTEAIGTAALVFGVLAIGANAQSLSEGALDLSAAFSGGIQPLLVGLLVLGIGISLGGPTGYAINPARDLGPRIAHFILPITGKGNSDWSYSWIPVVGPIIGGVSGAGLFRLLGL